MVFKASIIILVTLAGVFGLTWCTQMNTCSDFVDVYPTNVSFSINSYMCESTPCTCYLGCESRIHVEFIAPKYVEKIKPKIVASCMGVVIDDYPLHQTDACDGFTNTQCPIVKNEPVIYEYNLTIQKIFPEVTVNLKFSLVDEETQEDIACFVWDINVSKDDCPP